MSNPATSSERPASMVSEPISRQSASANRGWVVTFAGTGINLALGVLYTWSLFKDAIGREFGWKGEQLNDPYALCCVVFAFAMILAGRCQDKIGPRFTASIGGLLVGAGLLLISQTNGYLVWVLGFGVLVAVGLGFGYSSATPAALKWFPPARTGLIAGLVVSGFGLAPVYLSPLSKYLLAAHGLRGAMFIYAIAFAVAVCALAQLLTNPPAAQSTHTTTTTAIKNVVAGVRPGQVLRTPAFYLLWLLYFIGAGAGLMVISSISGMAKKSLGEAAFVAVAVMAIGNAAGRIGAGMLSDRIGRRWTLISIFLFQAVLMFCAIPIAANSGGAPWLIVLLATLIGFNYGANLSLFPAFAKDLWGLRDFGINYGLLFTAWGIGGLFLSRLQQTLTSHNGGSFSSSFAVAGGLLLAGTALAFAIRPPSKTSS